MTTPPHWIGGSEIDSDPVNASDRRGPWDKVYLGGEALPGVAEVSVQQARKIRDRGVPGRNGVRLIDGGAEAGKVSIRLKIWTPAQLDKLAQHMPSLNYSRERYTRDRTAQELADEAAARSQLYINNNSVASALGSFGPGLGGSLAVLSSQYDSARQINVTRTTTQDTRYRRAPVSIAHPAVLLAGITCVYVERVQIEPVRDQVLEVRFECLEYTADPRARTRTTSPRPRANANGDFTRPTAFDAPGATQPAGNAPATPPSRSNSGPSR